MQRFLLFFFALLGLCYLPIVEDGGLLPRQLLVGIWVIIGWFLLPLNERKQVMLGWGEVALLVWFGWMTLSLTWSINLGETWAWVGRWAVLIGFYMFIKTAWKTGSRDWRMVNLALVVYPLADFLFIVYQAYPLLVEGTFFEKIARISGSHGNKNLLAISFFLLTPMPLWAMRERVKPKAFYIVFTILSGCLLLTLQSRAVFLGLAVAVVVYLLLYIWVKSNRRMLAGFLIVMVGIGLYLLHVGATDVKYRAYFKNYTSVEERFDLWDNTWNMIAEHPITGVGAGQWQIWMPNYGLDSFDAYKVRTGLVTFQRPHNDYLWMIAEGGFVGLVLYLIFYNGAVWCLLKRVQQATSLHVRAEYAVLVGGLVGYAAIVQFDFPQERPELQVLLLLWLGYAYSRGEVNSVKVPGWLPLAFAALGLSVGFARFSAETTIKALKKAAQGSSYTKSQTLFPKASTYWCSVDATTAPLAWFAGAAAEQAGDMPRALALYSEGLEAAPFSFRTLNSKGIAFFRLGQGDSAIVYFKKALALAPRWEEPWLNWAAVLYQRPGGGPTAFELMRQFPKEMYDPRWPLFQKVLLEARLKDARPMETLENQVKIDTLLSDPNFPKQAYVLFEQKKRDAFFWR
jgi:O-antigen ligase